MSRKLIFRQPRAYLLYVLFFIMLSLGAVLGSLYFVSPAYAIDTSSGTGIWFDSRTIIYTDKQGNVMTFTEDTNPVHASTGGTVFRGETYDQYHKAYPKDTDACVQLGNNGSEPIGFLYVSNNGSPDNIDPNPANEFVVVRVLQASFLGTCEVNEYPLPDGVNTRGNNNRGGIVTMKNGRPRAVSNSEVVGTVMWLTPYSIATTGNFTLTPDAGGNFAVPADVNGKSVANGSSNKFLVRVSDLTTSSFAGGAEFDEVDAAPFNGASGSGNAMTLSPIVAPPTSAACSDFGIQVVVSPYQPVSYASPAVPGLAELIIGHRNDLGGCEHLIVGWVHVVNARPPEVPARVDTAMTATWASATSIQVNGTEFVDQGLADATTFTQSSIDGGAMQLSVDGQCKGTSNTIDVDPYLLSPYARLRVYGRTKGAICGNIADVMIKLTNVHPDATIDNTGAGTSGTSTGDSLTDTCPISSGSGIDFLLCPIWTLGSAAVKGLNNQIQILLFVSTDQIFGATNGAESNFHTAFNTFRNFSLGILVIAALIMVLSQAIGLDIVSAYTIRKTLPRIVIAAIGIAVSWQVLQITITFFNDLGLLISNIILSASIKPVGTDHNGFAQITGGALEILAGAGAFILSDLTIMGGLSFLVTIAIALLVGLIVLILRQLVIVVCILLTPVAIAAYVLPGTDKIWKFWRETLLGALVMFPLIMAFLSSGALVGSIAEAAADAARASGQSGGGQWDTVAVFAVFAPYLFISVAFNFAQGFMRVLTGMANDRSKGLFDGLKKYRQGEREYNREQRINGRSSILGSLPFVNRSRAGRAVAGGLDSFYRRTRTRGGFSLTRAGLDRYRALDQKRAGQVAAKAVQEGGDIAGDDLASRLAATEGMTNERFLREYATTYRTLNPTASVAQSERLARAALGGVLTNYGELGTRNAIVSGWKARAASNTGYEGTDAGLVELANDVRRMVRNGYIPEADAIGHVKALQTRLDQQGTWTAWFNMTRAELPTGDFVVGDAASDRLIDDFRNRTVTGNQLGRMAGGHVNAIKALAPVLAKRAKDAGDRLQTAIATGSADQDAALRNYMQRLADVMAAHDQAAGASPEVGDEVAGLLMNDTMFTPDIDYDPATHQALRARIPTDPRRRRLTISQAAESNRTDPVVQERRREWGSRSDRTPPVPPGMAAAPPAGGATPGAGPPPLGPP